MEFIELEVEDHHETSRSAFRIDTIIAAGAISGEPDMAAVIVNFCGKGEVFRVRETYASLRDRIVEAARKERSEE